MLRGWLHLAAFVAAIPAGVVLLARADGAASRATAAIYVSSLLLVLGTSSAYHCWPWAPAARQLLRRVDHSMIYVLIAGTYTPLCLLSLPAAWGIPLLVVVGMGAAIGVALKLAAFHRGGRSAGVLYLGLGWAAIATAPVLAQTLDTRQFTLLLLGGVAYTVGYPVLVLHRPDPWPRVFGYHEVWHSFTVLAAVLHFAAIRTVF